MVPVGIILKDLFTPYPSDNHIRESTRRVGNVQLTSNLEHAVINQDHLQPRRTDSLLVVHLFFLLK